MRDNNIGAFFALLRIGLWGDQRSVQQFNVQVFKDVDWNEVYQLVQEQSLQGLVLQGIEELRAKNKELNVPKVLLLQWIGEVQVIEQRNKAMNIFIGEVVQEMREKDINTLLVKGQGVARCYEQPLWRASGDIDFYMSESHFENAKMFFRPLVESFDPDNDVTRHINFHYGKWVVEIHANQHTDLSFRIDRVLDEIHQKIFTEGEVRTWDNNGTLVLLPSPENDVLIVFTHFIKHFFKGGLGLRQICDWCRLIWKYREALNTSILEQRLRQMGLFNEWKAFASMAVDWLGMPQDSMPFYSSDEKWSKKGGYIIDFILESGNFGHNRDTSYYQHKWRIMRKTGSFMRKVSDIFRHAYVFPDSIGFIPCIMYNGVKAAIRGE